MVFINPSNIDKFFDVSKYPIKVKIHLRFFSFFKESKDIFLKKLKINEITDVTYKDIILKNLRVELFRNDLDDVVLGHYGMSDHPSLILIEDLKKDPPEILLSLFNDKENIMDELKEISNILFASKKGLKKLIFFIYPCAYSQYAYIGGVDLEQSDMIKWLKNNIIRYIVLFLTPVITIYYFEILNKPLKTIDLSTAYILLFFYFCIFLFEWGIRNTSERFSLEIK